MSMGTADNVGISGARIDWQLSNVMQLQYAMRRNGGKLTKLFTGHDEMALPGGHVDIFQQLLQNIVDQQEAANSPMLRSSDAPRARTTVIGDMFTDLYDWAAINIGGTFGTTPYTYLSAPNAAYSTHATIDYTQPNAHLKYAVLGNIEIAGGTLVGTALTWAAPNTQTSLSDGDGRAAARGPGAIPGLRVARRAAAQAGTGVRIRWSKADSEAFAPSPIAMTICLYGTDVQSPAANTPGTDVRPLSSTTISPIRLSSTVPLTKSVFGRRPIWTKMPSSSSQCVSPEARSLYMRPVTLSSPVTSVVCADLITLALGRL